MKDYAIGIDIGSVATKGVLLSADQRIIDTVLLPTGWSPKKSGETAFHRLIEKNDRLETAGLPVVVTGYGRVTTDFATKVVTEITCHGKGASVLHSATKTIIDIGGQDSKVIHLSSTGKVLDFLMNDKCAAGTGKFMEVMATSLGVEVGDLSELARGHEGRKINSMCTVFAESEVISLLAEGASKGAVARGIVESTAKKAAVLMKRLGGRDDIFLTGGVSKSPLFREALEKELGTKVHFRREAQFAGAIGAAAIGLR